MEPSDAQECKDYIKLAYDISEKYDTVVLLRSGTRVSHSRGIVELGERVEHEIIPYEKKFMKYVAMPAMAKKLHVAQEQRLAQIAADGCEWDINEIQMKDPSIGIITSGICYQYAKDAMPEASFLKLGLVYPLPMDLIRKFTGQV